MADELDLVVTMFNDDWNNSNTSGVTPNINKIYDFKKVIDLDKKGHVLCYFVDSVIEAGDLGYLSETVTDTVTVDIRIVNKNHDLGRARMIELRDEAIRIVHLNRKDQSVGDYHIIQPIRPRDLSDRSSGLFRWIFDVQLKEWNRPIVT